MIESRFHQTCQLQVREGEVGREGGLVEGEKEGGREGQKEGREGECRGHEDEGLPIVNYSVYNIYI